MTRQDVVDQLTAERYTPHLPDYFEDDPERCALRYAALEEAAAGDDPATPGHRGSVAGYAWHRKHGDKVCEPCRLAKREYDRERYSRRRKETP